MKKSTKIWIVSAVSIGELVWLYFGGHMARVIGLVEVGAVVICGGLILLAKKIDESAPK